MLGAIDMSAANGMEFYDTYCRGHLDEFAETRRSV